MNGPGLRWGRLRSLLSDLLFYLALFLVLIPLMMLGANPEQYDADDYE